MVQKELERRKTNRRRSGIHKFSGKIRCGDCGSWYGSKTWHSTDQYRKTLWQCNHKFDGEKKCTTSHLTDEDIQKAFVSAANQLLANKDAIIKSLTAGADEAFDLAPLQAQEAELIEEVQMLTAAVEKCIYENAHVAQDQEEYQKRYDGLTEKYNAAADKLSKVSDQIAGKKSRQSTVKDFLKMLQEQDGLLTEFQENLWDAGVDYVTVYSANDIRITFKTGLEIKA